MNTEKCPCCNESFGKKELHLQSLKHRFNYFIWIYEKNRKSRCRNSDGILIDITPTDTDNSNWNAEFNFNEKKGEYIIEATINKFKMYNNRITFRCKIYNDRKSDNMILTSTNILDVAPWSRSYDDIVPDRIEKKEFVVISPKTAYNGFLIEFKLDSPMMGTFLIPLGIELQYGKTLLIFCRTILIKITLSIDRPLDDSDVTKKSPFTHKLWHKDLKEIKRINTPLPRDIFTVPLGCSKFFKFGLMEWDGIKMDELSRLEQLRNKMEPGYVTEKNYSDFFHTCLWIEEQVLIMMLRRYNMENITVEIFEKNFLKLRVPGLAEKRPSLIVGDLILMRKSGDKTGYEGIIKVVENEHIVIGKVNEELIKTLSEETKTELDVSFQLGRLPFERGHRAIESIRNKGRVKCLFPDNIRFLNKSELHNLKDSDFLNKSVAQNDEQKMAVRKILNQSSQEAPYIVFGPPGTGKTVTIVETIWQILRNTNKKVLVCAPANAACDMLTLKLMEHCTCRELLRIHSDSREKTSIPREIIPFSNFGGETDICRRIRSEQLNSYRVIVTTLILVGKYEGNGYSPDFVFIDEAGQALEPDVCIAFNLLKHNGSIILAGDPQQLGPIVMSKALEKFHFDQSLLERLVKTQHAYKSNDSNFITMLRKNFRSHPQILEIPNQLFYDGRLIACSVLPEQDPVSKLAIFPQIKNLHWSMKGANIKKKGIGQALEFCAVSSKEKREGRSPSYYNIAEIHMVKEYITTLLSLNLDPMVKTSDIGVITPYIRQVYKIKNVLKANNMEDVEVGSTEAFQGREKRIMIISTVRAQYDLLQHDMKYSLGFVKQEKRFNVALSRAISKEIIIGCPTVLITDKNWRKFIEMCQELGSYFGMPLYERTGNIMANICENLENFSINDRGHQ